MKVILLQDVAKIGRRFEVVSVPDGYAQNKLIPQRLAEPATPANLKRVAARNQKQAADTAETTAAFTAAATALKGKIVSITAEANDDGTLFQALKPAAVTAAIQRSLSLAVPEAWVHIAPPIKSVGEHTVLLSHGELQAECQVEVIKK